LKHHPPKSPPKKINAAPIKKLPRDCRKNRKDPTALEKLRKYPYPGNVRELKAIIELAAVMTNTEIIEPDDINLSSNGSVNDLLQEEMTLEGYNRLIITHFLKKYDNKVRLVAQKLDIGKTTIYRMMKDDELV